MDTVFDELGDIGIIPVVKIDDPGMAPDLADALIAGGIPCAEITFRTSQGLAAIGKIAGAKPELLVGAGTVLTVEQADEALAAGARFIVSPGLDSALAEHCAKKGAPFIPGCVTPSEMGRALALGLETVKFFPAEQSGGLDYIKAVSAPLSKLRFVPTGGINAKNIGSYSAFEKILACGGSWMVPPDLVRAGQFEEITRLCREAVQNMHGFSVVHVGINAGTEGEARQSAEQFESLFGLSLTPRKNSFFAGPFIEIMKGPGFGRHGHIAVEVNNIRRARSHLERQNCRFREDGLKTGASGRLAVAYLQNEIGGFAVHLIQRK